MEPQPSASSQLKREKTTLCQLRHDHRLPHSLLAPVHLCLASKALTRASSLVSLRSHHHLLALLLNKLSCRRQWECRWLPQAWVCRRCKCNLRRLCQCMVVHSLRPHLLVLELHSLRHHSHSTRSSARIVFHLAEGASTIHRVREDIAVTKRIFR
jgi:hypothetical protein